MKNFFAVVIGAGALLWVGTAFGAPRDCEEAGLTNVIRLAQLGTNTYTGTDAAECIVGTNGDDVINGGGGDDIILGRRGNDVLMGGAGNDLIRGNKGNDTIFGGPGDDDLFGGKDGDAIDGGPGDDTIRGRKGDDQLVGGPGADDIRGNKGADHITGDADDTFNRGGRGTDSCGNANCDRDAGDGPAAWVVSKSNTRDNPMLLDGTTQRGDIYAFVSGAGIVSVDFKLNGHDVLPDAEAPFDVCGTRDATRAWSLPLQRNDIRSRFGFSAGSKVTLTATVYYADSSETVEATFTVAD